MKWIDCRERLPEILGGWVLVVDNDGAVNDEFGSWSFVYPAYWRDGAFHHPYEGWKFYNVTHWMPLPKTPKEEI